MKELSRNVNMSDFKRHSIVKDAQECRNSKQLNSPFPDSSKKFGLAIWICRNCGLTHGAKLRSAIINDLSKKSFNLNLTLSCVKNKRNGLKLTNEKLLKIISSYKFYMAFENTHECREYITEKFWYNSLYAGAVPIVWGPSKKDYQRIAPPKSFIFYEDFQNIEEFIDYINYLDKNDTAYLEYFSWRKQFPCKYSMLSNKRAKSFATFVNPFTNAYCNLCKTLREKLNSSHHKTIPSLNKYWFGEENKNCLK